MVFNMVFNMNIYTYNVFCIFIIFIFQAQLFIPPTVPTYKKQEKEITNMKKY